MVFSLHVGYKLVLKRIVQYSNIRSLQYHLNVTARIRIFVYYVIGPHVTFHVSRSINMASKSRPLRSPVWAYFEIVGEKKVRCKLCVPPATTTLAYHGGTTSMQSHLSSHHPDKYAGESSKESQSQRKLDSFVHAKKCPAERAI